MTEFTCKGEWLGTNRASMTVAGEVDLATAHQCHGVLDDLSTQASIHHLIIDLSDCTFIDSTGLSLLVAAQRQVTSRLAVVAPHSQVRRTLTVAGLDTVFVVHMTTAEALAGLEEAGQPS